MPTRTLLAYRCVNMGDLLFAGRAPICTWVLVCWVYLRLRRSARYSTLPSHGCPVVLEPSVRRTPLREFVLFFRCAQISHMIDNFLNLLVVLDNLKVSDTYGLPMRNAISQAHDAIDGILPFINQKRREVLLPIQVKATKQFLEPL